MVLSGHWNGISEGVWRINHRGVLLGSWERLENYATDIIQVKLNKMFLSNKKLKFKAFEL